MFDEDVIDEEVEETEDDETTEPSNDDEGDVSARLTALEAKNTLNGLLADPEIAKVVELKRAGKKINIAEVDSDEGSDEEEEEENLGEGAGAELIKRLIGVVDKKLSPIADRLKAIEGFANDSQRKEINAQVASVREKHKDFDKFKDQMLKLSADNPGLSVEELYYVAKARSGKLEVKEEETFSEQPTHQPRRPKVKKTARRGRAGFHNAVQEALKELDLGGLER